jgi:hypothetical protein
MMYSNLLAWLLSVALLWQPAPGITADNIDRLTSVARIDFADLPPAAGEVRNGRMFVTAAGDVLAVVNTTGQVVWLRADGTLLGVSAAVVLEDGRPATFLDGAFDSRGQRFAALYTGGNRYFLSVVGLDGSGRTLAVRSENKPVTVWWSGAELWLEVIPARPDEAPFLLVLDASTMGDQLIEEATLTRGFFASASDPDAVVRIGRLAPPLAVTANAAGLTTRWDLEAGRATAQAQLDDVPVYGHATPDGDHLVWRDPASMALHLLDFTSGADRVIAALDGTYIPFLFITPGVDAVLGVHVNNEPLVVGWDVATGERLPLGLYRQCRRPPDMVRLSGDGSTLVIGCDTGLDVWRVQGSGS